MRTAIFAAALVVACSKPDVSPIASASSSASAVAPKWKPHKLSRTDAMTLCAELIEGGITSECASKPGDDPTSDAFLIPGRQRTEAHGIINSFDGREPVFARWLADSVNGGGPNHVPPVYHYSQKALILVSFSGDVPEETKLRVAEALDAL